MPPSGRGTKLTQRVIYGLLIRSQVLIDYEPKSPKHVPSKVRRLKVISSFKLRVVQPKVKALESPSSATAFGKPALFLEPYNQPIMQQPPLADPSPKLSIFPPYETRRPAPSSSVPHFTPNVSTSPHLPPKQENTFDLPSRSRSPLSLTS